MKKTDQQLAKKDGEKMGKTFAFAEKITAHFSKKKTLQEHLNTEDKPKNQQENKLTKLFKDLRTYIFLFGIFTLSLITFGTMFNHPDAPFWDENYHITSGQKYVEGEYFMELHPPLGKLFIGLGEKIFHPNDGVKKVHLDKRSNLCKTFLQTDYMSNAPTSSQKCQNIFRGKENKCIDYIAWKKENGIDPQNKENKIEPKIDENCQAKVKEMTFVGYRFFPVLFAIFSSIFFFLTLLIFTKNHYISSAFTLLYIFDNALVVHFRGAMLEGIQMFFILMTTAFFAYLWQGFEKNKLQQYAILGSFSGLVLATKINGLILILLFLPLILRDISPFFQKFNKKNILLILKEIFTKGFVYAFCLVSVFAFVYFVHINIGKNTNAHKYYITKKYIQKDEENCDGDSWKNSGIFKCRYEKMKDIIDKNEQTRLVNFPRVFMENVAYNLYYSKGVPALDVTSPGENGSSPWSWPQGNKAINYRWDAEEVPQKQYEKTSLKTICENKTEENANLCKQDFKTLKDACLAKFDGYEKFCEKRVSYFYLQQNPVVWSISLMGVIFAFVWVVGHLIFNLPVKNKSFFVAVTSFLAMYLGYMVAVSQIKRVMYLYHYFIPLVFGMILSGMMFLVIYQQILNHRKYKFFAYFVLFLIVILVLYAFWFFSPFTYYTPINEADFNQRVWNHDWQLKPVK